MFDCINPQAVNNRIASGFEVHVAPDTDIGQSVDPIPAIRELRLTKPLTARPHSMSIQFAVLSRIWDTAVDRAVRNGFRLILARRSFIKRELAPRCQPDHQLITARRQQSFYINLDGNECVCRFSGRFTVNEYLPVQIQAAENYQLPFMIEESLFDFKIRFEPPRPGFRPTAIRHIVAYRRLFHHPGVDKIQMYFARNFSIYPTIPGLKHTLNSRVSGKRKIIRSDFPYTV